MPDLAQLQRSFYDRVVSHQPVDDLIGTGDVNVYARMYTSRLYDTLADDYPKLRVALGEECFGDVVAQYLRDRPPSSFTLRDAGLGLAAFLRDTAIAPAWASELATLERARVEVFDGPDARPLAQDEVAALGDELPGLLLSWVPSSVVVPLTWTVDDLWSAIEDEQPPSEGSVPGSPGEPASEGSARGSSRGLAVEPAREARVVLVWRREVAVLHRTLDTDEGRLALPLAAGAQFSEICEVLGELHGEDASARAVELLLRWLQAAALDGSPLDRARGPG